MFFLEFQNKVVMLVGSLGGPVEEVQTCTVFPVRLPSFCVRVGVAESLGFLGVVLIAKMKKWLLTLAD